MCDSPTRSPYRHEATPDLERPSYLPSFLLCVGLSLVATTAPAQNPTAIPAQLEERIRAEEYRLTWHEATHLKGVSSAWQAPNRANGFLTYFSATGIRLVHLSSNDERRWQTGLSLLGFGRGTLVAALETPSLAPDDRRIEYRRDDVIEWYVNDASGLEQGFVLRSPPEEQSRAESVPGVRRGAPDEAVYLILKLEGSLAGRISADGQAVDLLPRSGGLAVLHYGNLEVRDATGRRLTSWIEGFAEAGMRGLRLVFEDEDAVYPLTVDPLVSAAAWTGEPDGAGAAYGFSVASAGDVNNDGYDDVVVGAPYYWGGAADTGRVYVYHGTSSGLEPDPAWIAAGEQENGQFGYSVASAGDVNNDGYDDVIIGSPQFSNGESWEGAAFVFYGSAGGLPACGGSLCTPGDANWSDEIDQPGAGLGRSVASAGDVNDDGFADLIAGGSGVFVYHGAPTGPAASPTWTTAGDPNFAGLGASVASAGDVNNDGYADIIVGAPMYDFGGGLPHAGAAFVFRGSATGLDALSFWLAGSDKIDDRVASSVAGAGDVNGDGYDDIVIGAPEFDLGDGKTGTAFVFHGPLDALGCGDVGESPCGPPDAHWSGVGENDTATTT